MQYWATSLLNLSLSSEYLQLSIDQTAGAAVGGHFPQLNYLNDFVRDEEYLMVLLFWQEYLSNSSRDKALFLESQLLGSSNTVAMKKKKMSTFEKTMVGQVHKALTGFHSGVFKKDVYEQDMEYVGHFVLPFGFTQFGDKN